MEWCCLSADAKEGYVLACREVAEGTGAGRQDYVVFVRVDECGRRQDTARVPLSLVEKNSSMHIWELRKLLPNWAPAFPCEAVQPGHSWKAGEKRFCLKEFITEKGKTAAVISISYAAGSGQGARVTESMEILFDTDNGRLVKFSARDARSQGQVNLVREKKLDRREMTDLQRQYETALSFDEFVMKVADACLKSENESLRREGAREATFIENDAIALPVLHRLSLDGDSYIQHHALYRLMQMARKGSKRAISVLVELAGSTNAIAAMCAQDFLNELGTPPPPK